LELKLLKNNNRTALIPGVILLLFLISACGEDKKSAGITHYDPVNTTYARSIGGGTATDISAFNGKSIYALLSYMPADKTESDYPPATSSDWILTSTIFGSSSIAASEIENILNGINYNSLSESKVYSSAQTGLDIKLRKIENDLLAGRVSQLSKKSGINASSATYAVGDDRSNITIALTSATITAQCRVISAHAYFFVDKRDLASTYVSDSVLNDYAAKFETIYALNHSKFGTENDTDSNGKVIIVFTEEIKSPYLGYFYAKDKFPKTSYTDSNEGDIFYMTVDPVLSDTICATLAHEFQHMIYFDQHHNRGVTNTYSWLNEALSQAAEYYSTYTTNHLNWINNFLSGGWYGLSLTCWTGGNYGYGAIFIRYLIDQYGDLAIKNMCSTDKIGIAAVEYATGTDFNTIFYNFTIALAVSGTGDSADPKFNFKTLNLQSVQSSERTGLLPHPTILNAGSGLTSWNYPYEIFLVNGSGAFGKIKLSGTDIIGTAFGLNW